MSDCNSSFIPAVKTDRTALLSTTTLLDRRDITKYQSVVGALLYLSVCTRPDITFAVMQLTRHLIAPTTADWSAALLVMRYLKGVQRGLTYTADSTDTFRGYADADWAGDVATRKSTSGYVFMWQDCAISWRSKLQSINTLSSTEAEYVALCSAAQEAVYLRRLFNSIGEQQLQPTLLLEDNESAIKLVVRDEDAVTDRSKHIDVRYHYTKQLVNEKQVRLEHVATIDQLADMFTKGLPRVQLRKLSAVVMNSDL
jgi:hypothetical protein